MFASVIKLAWSAFEYIVYAFDSLRPSQQFFSHFGTDLPGLNQYLALDKVFCSRTQRSASNEDIVYAADVISRQHFLNRNILAG